MSRFPSGLVLVVVLGLGLTSAYKIDDPFPSEWEKDTVEDMTDEMNRLDNLNHKKKDEEQTNRLDELNHKKKDEEQTNRLDELNHKKKDEEQAKRSISASFINSRALQFKNECKLETESKISEKEIVEKREAFLKALKKDYQILQHGKGSIASDESWLNARQSEVCGACVLKKLCERTDVLTHLSIDPNLSR